MTTWWWLQISRQGYRKVNIQPPCSYDTAQYCNTAATSFVVKFHICWIILLARGHTFCVTSLPPASTRWFVGHYEASAVHILAAALSINLKAEARESNRGRWVRSENAVHRAMWPPSRNHTKRKNLIADTHYRETLFLIPQGLISRLDAGSALITKLRISEVWRLA